MIYQNVKQLVNNNKIKNNEKSSINRKNTNQTLAGEY